MKPAKRCSPPAEAGSETTSAARGTPPGRARSSAARAPRPRSARAGGRSRVPELRVETVVPEERLGDAVDGPPRRASVRGAGLRRLPAASTREGEALHRRRLARQPRPGRVRATCSRPRTARCSTRGARRSASRRTTSPSTRALVAGLERAVELGVDELEVVLRLGAPRQADARGVPREERGAAGALPRRVARSRARSAG